MYQLIVPVGFVGIIFYLHREYEKHCFYNHCLYNGTFDDFYIVDVKKDL